MDLDEILSNFGLGSYQVTVCALMGLVLMYSNISPLSYAITASDLKYRCEIPQCDIENPVYKPVWLERVVPFNEKTIEPYKCLKYHYQPTTNGTVSSTNDTCNFEAFDVNSKEKCNKWVFDETERTILNDFGLMCEDNKWKLSMVGTVNSIGQFIGIPLAGFISDKYGRKFILIIGSVTSAILGTARSFTADYYSFLLFELLDSMASSGVYAATFVLGLELVSPKSRVTVSTLMGCFYPMGAVIMGFAAYMILDWRIMLRVLYLPGLLILGYAWYVPESMRWLQTQNRIEDMANVLSKIAKSNGKTLPSSVKEALIANTLANAEATNTPDESQLSCVKLISKIFSSKEIFLRLINCSFCWTTITLVYYGLSLTSVEFSGNKYLNFMLVNAVEVPAFLTSWYFMEHYSRRNTQALSFIFSGIGCIAVNMVNNDYVWVKLILFLSSKYAITMSFNTMYVFTAEMFPTELRMSLFGIASMFGRMGSMFAPQMTLLSAYFGTYVPIMLFGIISFMAGALAFLFPETKDQKLPDTVKQAEFVGEV
ncbi:solute carrier family 22 member 21-like isoform X2 [Melanaphis sacchari]|uniref:Solute carrier family 22 member 21 n=2 Tax=Melanaphis sacchari TaxID=742174 RepID=A0A2H8TDX2_9HEMI|nr:solute carrier family 22 member 21-like isoform X2 [Melanaphis sacchari]